MTTGQTDPDDPDQRALSRPPTLSRRAALALGGLAVTRVVAGPQPAAASAPVQAGVSDQGDPLRPAINPRETWGADLPIVGEILPEEDVRFLLVHHTASTNDYGPGEVIDQIRGFYDFHTSAEKGWPDVAYNFFIDRFGGIWEARAGSAAGPVRGDATGGSQGFGLLCSLIGDHSKVAVSDEAQSALVSLLAWLAERHRIDTTPGTEIEFVSRGSNRWPAGTPVSTSTISGHRDMSQTSCPGDFAYDLLAVDIPSRVSELRLAAASAAQATASSEEQSGGTNTADEVPEAAVEPAEAAASGSGSGSGADSDSGSDEQALDPLGDDTGAGDGTLSTTTTVGIAATVAAALAAGMARLRRRAGGPDMWDEL